jgi:hypothetical protein
MNYYLIYISPYSQDASNIARAYLSQKQAQPVIMSGVEEEKTVNKHAKNLFTVQCSDKQIEEIHKYLITSSYVYIRQILPEESFVTKNFKNNFYLRLATYLTAFVMLLLMLLTSKFNYMYIVFIIASIVALISDVIITRKNMVKK